jgi:hypothetical protein
MRKACMPMTQWRVVSGSGKRGLVSGLATRLVAVSLRNVSCISVKRSIVKAPKVIYGNRVPFTYMRRNDVITYQCSSA